MTCLFFLVGCFPPKAARYNQIEDGFNNYLTNPILGMVMTFPGDYAFDSQIRGKAIREWRAWAHPAVKPYLGRRTAVLYAHTTLEPNFNVYLVQLPTRVIEAPDWQAFFQEVYNGDHRTFEAVDSTQNALYHALVMPDHVLLFGAKSQEDNGFDNLLREFNNSILPSIRTGPEYLDGPLISPFEIADQNYQRGEIINYLAPITALRSEAGAYKDSKQQQSTFLQAYLTFACGIRGLPEFDSAYQVYESLHFNRIQGPIENMEAAVYDRQAKSRIMELARTRQVVMFNELHFVPSHRTLVSDLLPKFKAEGFTALAMETLSWGDTQLNERGYPVQASGYYSREPEMAHLIRTAQDLGFRLVPYEDTTGQGREENQARNLIEGTLRRFPKEKVLVLAGYGHIHEDTQEGRRSMMAAEFQRLTEIDPLTIDQVDLHKFRGTVQERGHTLALLENPVLPNTSHTIDTDLYLINALPPPSMPEQALPTVALQVPKGNPVGTVVYLQQEWEAQGYEAVPRQVHWGVPATLEIEPGAYQLLIHDAAGSVLYSDTWRVK